MNLHPADYRLFEEILKRESGLALTPDKTYLLEARLAPVVRHCGAENLSELALRLRQGDDASLLRAVVEAMATSETSFFRDLTPFQRLRDNILPAFIKARAGEKTLRIWSAACASGQEAYSIAMMLREMPQLQGWRCEIVASDLSQDILEKARAASFNQFEVQRGLPIAMLVKYFTREGDRWRLKNDIRNMVAFRQSNLLTDACPGVFDIIFCRNVLIYFDVPTKAKVLQSLRYGLRQDGVLVLGGAETVLGVSADFQPLNSVQGFYARSDTTFGA